METIMTKSNKTVVEAIEAIVEVATPSTKHTEETGAIRKKSSFGKTYYYINTKRDRLSKGPNQMLGIVKWMIDNKITSEKVAMQGAEIGRRAIVDGHVKTAKLTGEVIFAYYIRRMEQEQGIEHAKTTHAKTGKVMA